MTDNSAFKKRIRARMAETSEKYTVARRAVLSGRILRIQLDVEVDAPTAQAYTDADEDTRRAIVSRLITEETADEDTAIRAVIQRGVDRTVGVSAVTVRRTPDRVEVSIRAERPIALTGPRGDDADRLRTELEHLTGRRVSLEIR